MLSESPGGSTESIGGKKRGKESRDSMYLERSTSGKHITSYNNIITSWYILQELIKIRRRDQMLVVTIRDREAGEGIKQKETVEVHDNHCIYTYNINSG